MEEFALFSGRREEMGYAYRSAAEPSWTLFTERKDDFETIPETELARFGKPLFDREVDLGVPLSGGPNVSQLEDFKNKGYLFLQTEIAFRESVEPEP
jgi:uncharacterized protein YcgL (UPF0745 family)